MRIINRKTSPSIIINTRNGKVMALTDDRSIEKDINQIVESFREKNPSVDGNTEVQLEIEIRDWLKKNDK